jgi:DNA-binding response OmpR family regulator
MHKVLIVEDDLDIAKALALRLNAEESYQAIIAQDAVQAMSQAINFQPDVVLLDILLPAGDGFKVFERLQMHPNIEHPPVIFMTASKQPGLREKAEAAGAAGFFEKPMDTHQLMDMIAEVVGRKAG